MTGRRFFRIRSGSRVVESTVTNRASGVGPRGVATGTASSASIPLRAARPSRGTMATPSRAVGTLTSPAFAPESAIVSTCATCSTDTPASAARTRSTRKTRRAWGASTVQSTSTTPGVDAMTALTRAAAASRVLSSAA
jgi:hypothetical protein